MNTMPTDRLTITQPLTISTTPFMVDSNGPFILGFETLAQQMAYLSTDAQDYYKELQAKIQLSKDADKLLANFNPHSAAEFLNKYYPKPPGGGQWSEENTAELKAGLESFKNSQSDFVAESQLKIQRVMQTYNTTATLYSSLQTMLGEMNKMIVQSMR